MNFADRMSRLGTESAFEVLARAKALERQGKEIIHLEIGEPDFDTPVHIRDAGKRALDDGFTHYGPAAGLPELREAIAKDVAATRNIAVTPDEIVVTPGAKPIMYFVIHALVNPGEEVIYPNPGFPIYESVINFVGGVGVPIPLREESGFGFDLDLLEKKASAKTKLIVINSPQNPTGGVLEVDQLGRIAEIARRYRIPVTSCAFSQMHIATMLGNKFSVIDFAESHNMYYYDLVVRHHFAGRCASIRSIDYYHARPGHADESTIADEREKALRGEPSRAVERAVEEAVAAIQDDGAEVLTFGCSDAFWLQPFVQQRLEALGWEVPVLEGYSCAIVLARLFVDLGVDASGLAFPGERPRQWRRKKVF